VSEAKVDAWPGDTVRRLGMKRDGRVLDWNTQSPIIRRELEKSHYAVQPIGADGRNVGEVGFWPKDSIVTIKTRPAVHVPRPEDVQDLRYL